MWLSPCYPRNLQIKPSEYLSSISHHSGRSGMHFLGFWDLTNTLIDVVSGSCGCGLDSACTRQANGIVNRKTLSNVAAEILLAEEDT
jgi:hypothetical protein